MPPIMGGGAPPMGMPAGVPPLGLGIPGSAAGAAASAAAAARAAAPVTTEEVSAPVKVALAKKSVDKSAFVYADDDVSMEEKRAGLDKYRYDEESIKNQLSSLDAAIQARLQGFLK